MYRRMHRSFNPLCIGIMEKKMETIGIIGDYIGDI